MNGIEVIIFGIKLTVKPIAFTLKLGNFEWDIYWYGIIIALGFLLAVIYALRNYKRFNLDIDRMLDVVLVTVPVSILCARIYYVLFDGVKETELFATSGQIVVQYNGSFCKYTFSGEPSEYGLFFNRNGRYRVYKINTDKLHIEIGDINEL